MNRLLLLLICSIALNGILFSQTKTSPRTGDDYYDLLAPFRNAIWFGTNGDISHNPFTDAAGWEWMKGSGKTVCYESGIILGGLIEGNLRLTGSKYRHALQGGKILSNGVASDPQDTLSRIFHISKKDSINHPDRIQWNLNDGAPVDANGKPLMRGDEQIWFVSNDLNPNRSSYFYGTLPIGIEVQTLAWAEGRQWLEDAIFIQHKIINKGNVDFKKVYLGLWADFDLGNPVDDLVGVDTTIQLYYVYNAVSRDAIYGFPPPAAGIVLLESPLIPSPNHSVISNGKFKKGFCFTQLSGFMMYLCGDAIYREPAIGTGTLEMYNNLKGLLWNGTPIVDPTTNKPTRYCVPGDPVRKVGWIGGLQQGSDCSAMMSVGPFTIAKGDTQLIAYALIAAQDIDRLSSVERLKYVAKYCRTYYGTQPATSVNSSSIPIHAWLSQNYPNPISLSGINSTATMEYSIPSQTHIQLKLFDILGREIATLVDEETEAGFHKAKFDLRTSRRSESSTTFVLCPGVYFYRLYADKIIITKKMIVTR